MRNWFSSDCDCNCSNPEPVVGVIINGRKFPFGIVKESEYDADMEELQATIKKLSNDLATVQTDTGNLKSVVIGGKLAEKTSENSAAISAAQNDVNSNRTEINALDDRVDDISTRLTVLEGGTTIEILSFTATPNKAEVGSTVNVVLSWALMGNAAAVSINGTAVTGNSVTMPNVIADTTYTLTVTDTRGRTYTATASVSFRNRVFWGTSSDAVPEESTVKGLDRSDLSNSAERTITVDANGQYIYYAYPARLGKVTMFVNGFEGGFNDPATIAVDNGSGFEENYYAYRSEEILTGSVTIEFKKA